MRVQKPPAAASKAGPSQNPNLLSLLLDPNNPLYKEYGGLADKLSAANLDLANLQAQPFKPSPNQFDLEMANRQAEMGGLQTGQEPVLEMPQYNPPARPAMAFPGLPERPETNVHPAVAMLAGIGGLIAPGGAGGFGAAAIQGAKEQANQVYQDRVAEYNQRMQQALAKHEDELAARNDLITFAKMNLDRNAQNEFNRSVAKWHAGGVEAKREALADLMVKLGKMSEQTKGNERMQRDIGLQMQKIANLQAGLASVEKFAETVGKISEQQINRLQTDVHRIQLEEIAKGRLQESKEWHDLLWPILRGNLGARGMTVGPGGIPMPTPEGDLPPALAVDIAAKRALATNREVGTKDRDALSQTSDNLAATTAILSNMGYTPIIKNGEFAGWKPLTPEQQAGVKARSNDTEAKKQVTTTINAFLGLLAKKKSLEARTKKASSPMAASTSKEPPRPANVPKGFVFNAKGPKGAGWYRP